MLPIFIKAIYTCHRRKNRETSDNCVCF